MPGKGIRNAVYKRAGGKGQSSKFYNIYGQVVKPSDPNGFKGGQGWTTHNPSIGSMLSLGIAKQNKNAGGNNVCDPGPGPKNSCVPKDGSNNLGVGGPGGVLDYYGYEVATPVGTLSPLTAPGGGQFTEIAWEESQGEFAVVTSPASSSFESISFINCDDNTVRTYFTGAATITTVVSGATRYAWADPSGNFTSAEELAYWSAAVGKTLKVVINDLTLAPTGNGTGDYCCTNNDCDCRGPLAQCPCRKGGC